MADDQDKEQKTEEATPRKREEARDNGQVALSTETMAALMLCAAMVALMLGGGLVARSVGSLIVGSFEAIPGIGTSDLSLGDSAALMRQAMYGVFGPIIVVFLPVLAVGLLVGYGQVGFRVTPKAVQFDLSKLDPAKGFKRLFSARSAVRTLLAAAKVGLISTCMVIIAWSQIAGVIRLGPSELGPLLVGLGHVAVRCVAGALIAIVILSLVDLAFQRWQLERDLRMSRQEVKEEHRITEGDPHVKARVRQIQREMATNRMMADVPKATVVVTNPTHFSVALLYDRAAEGRAPRVVAKGVDFVAQRILKVASEAGVLCYEDPALARALHAQAHIGQEIPEDLYAVVAEVLAYVYRLQGLAA